MCGYAHTEETGSHIAQASHKLRMYYLTFLSPPPEHWLQKGVIMSDFSMF